MDTVAGSGTRQFHEVGVSVNDDVRAALQAAIGKLCPDPDFMPTANSMDEAIWRAACAFTFEQAAKMTEMRAALTDGDRCEATMQDLADEFRGRAKESI